MNIVLAVEDVRIFLGIVISFDLDGCVEQVVLSAAKVGDCSECLQGLVRLNMDRHGVLTH